MRLCLLALCVYVLGRLPGTRRERLLTYLVLIVPQAFHSSQRPSEMLDETIFLGVLFGLPLAFLLNRFGLLSAAVAHTIVRGRATCRSHTPPEMAGDRRLGVLG